MVTINERKTGINIRLLMDAHNVSFADVQSACDVEPQAVYNWLNGKNLPSTMNLVKIARLLGCTLGDLLVVEEVQIE